MDGCATAECARHDSVCSRFVNINGRSGAPQRQFPRVGFDNLHRGTGRGGRILVRPITFNLNQGPRTQIAYFGSCSQEHAFQLARVQVRRAFFVRRVQFTGVAAKKWLRLIVSAKRLRASTGKQRG